MEKYFSCELHYQTHPSLITSENSMDRAASNTADGFAIHIYIYKKTQLDLFPCVRYNASKPAPRCPGRQHGTEEES